MFDIQTELHLRRTGRDSLADGGASHAAPVIVILLASDLLVLAMLAAAVF